MSPDEYINLAGQYCLKMEWNLDAIPELAKCLEEHDEKHILDLAEQKTGNASLFAEKQDLEDLSASQGERILALERALSDAVSTYLGNDKIVTAERIETWQAVLSAD